MHGMREIAALAAQLVFAGAWQGLVLVVLLSLGFRLLPRSSARLRSALWVCGFGLAVLVPLLHLVSARNAATGAAAPHEVLRIQPVWGYALAALWAVLVLVRGTRLATHGLRLRGIWRRATPMATDGDLREMLTSGRRRAVLCRSAEVESPAVIGFLAPRLLLPHALVETLDADDLGQIALHEMEHLRRRDDWVNLLQKLALVVFPLDPALLWMDRRLSVERELACDAGVVARTAAPLRYAACLTRLAEQRMRCRVAALSLAAWSRRPELTRRVETLLQPMGVMSRTQTKFAVALLLLGLGGGAAEMARAPRWIALAEPANGGSSAVEGMRAVRGEAMSASRATAVVYGDGVGSRAAGAVRGAMVREANYVVRPSRVYPVNDKAGLMKDKIGLMKDRTGLMKDRTGRSQRRPHASTGATPGVPQRLKPRLLLSGDGTAEAVPFRRAVYLGNSDAVPFRRAVYLGNSEAVPFRRAVYLRNSEAVPFRRAVSLGTPDEAGPSDRAGSLGSAEAAPFRSAGSLGLSTAVHARRKGVKAHEIPAVPVYTLTIQHLPSYAAVPFGDGWILVQL